MRKKYLLKTAFLIFLLLLIAPRFLTAGFPVIDWTNLIQTAISAKNQVESVTKQVDQFRTQIKQYEIMIKDSVAPAVWIWDDVNRLINEIADGYQTLEQLKETGFNIEQYTSHYTELDNYRYSPCFKHGGCGDGELGRLLKKKFEGYKDRKRLNAEHLKTIEKQDAQLKKKAAKLKDLAKQAKNAEGQLQAIAATNQYLDAQTKQLTEINSLLASQAQTVAIRDQIITDREALEQSESEKFRGGGFKKYTPKYWKI